MIKTKSVLPWTNNKKHQQMTKWNLIKQQEFCLIHFQAIMPNWKYIRISNTEKAKPLQATKLYPENILYFKKKLHKQIGFGCLVCGL